MRRLTLTAQFSHHLNILQTKPTTKIQEAKLVERSRYIRRSIQRREVGVVQVLYYHLKKVKLKFVTEIQTHLRNNVWGLPQKSI